MDSFLNVMALLIDDSTTYVCDINWIIALDPRNKLKRKTLFSEITGHKQQRIPEFF
jgi:hypothetical protein